jgi:hypothetical protein
MDTLAEKDYEQLLRLRLVVARFGEMDLARWWDTKSMLAKTGRVAVSRGLPKTHRFAQARAVFAVARARCREVYNPSDGVTLWDLPADIESAFEARWQAWIENLSRGQSVFDSLEAIAGDDLLPALTSIAQLPPAALDGAKHMKRAADQKAIPLGEVSTITLDLITRLAAGFSKSEPGKVAVPYAKLWRTT